MLVNASLGMEQLFPGNFALNAGATYGERMPNESEQFGFYLYNAYDGYDYVGRTNLNSEKSVQGELTIKYDYQKFAFSITGFYYHFSRYIMGITDPALSPMTIGATGVKVYENLGYADLAGTESQLSLKLGRFEILNVAKLVYGKTIDHEPLPLIPPFKNNLNLAFHAGISWHLFAEWEAATAQYRINESFGESATPGYSVANARVEKTFMTNFASIKASAAIDNMFDTRYHEHLDWGALPRMGRNIQLSVFISY
jgi:iron complex outermembrane receptor protein